MRNLPHNFFYLKTKISVDFQICISVRLIINIWQTIRQFYLGTLVLSIALLRSSRSQMFFKLRVLKNFANFRGKHLCWISEQLQWLLLNKRNYKYTENKYTTALSWNSALFLSTRSQMFCEIVVLKACNFIHATKESPKHVFSCENCEIFKNTCFYRTRPVTASDCYYGGNTKYGLLLKFLFLRKQQYRISKNLRVTIKFYEK